MELFQQTSADLVLCDEVPHEVQSYVEPESLGKKTGQSKDP